MKKSPSCMHQGRWAIDNHISKAGGCTGWRICLDLGSLVHSTTQSSPAIPCCNAITCAAMQNLEVKNFHYHQAEAVKLYNTCILPIFLYSFECWAVNKRDVLEIDDALNQWCLQKLLGIKKYYHVWNDNVRWTTKQPHVLAIVQAWHFSLFDHTAWMPDDTEAKILTVSPWRTGGDHQDALVLWYVDDDYPAGQAEIQ